MRGSVLGGVGAVVVGAVVLGCVTGGLVTGLLVGGPAFEHRNEIEFIAESEFHNGGLHRQIPTITRKYGGGPWFGPEKVPLKYKHIHSNA